MKEFKTYILLKEVSRHAMRVNLGNDNSTFIHFSTIGFGSAYNTGFPTFSTADANIQAAIENSDMFRDKSIILAAAVETEDTEEVATEIVEGNSDKAANITPLQMDENEALTAKNTAWLARIAELEATQRTSLEQPEASKTETVEDEGEEAGTQRNSDTEVVEVNNPKVHPEVVNWQEARDVLIRTYKVPHQALRGEVAIRTQATTLGVCFPNAV